MGRLGRVLLVRGLTLLGVLVAVLLILVVSLGATGLSDKILQAVIGEELRGLRQTLAQTIRDPEELERVLLEKRGQLMEYYGLNVPWYHRLPATMLRVMTLDLGYARTIRSFQGSSRVVDIVLERLPLTLIMVTSALAITAAIGLAVGVRLATRVGSRLDRAASYISAASYATPTWWLGIILILTLSFQLRVFPFGGLHSIPPPTEPLSRTLDLLWHAVLPVITLVLASLGSWTYVVRTMVLNVAQEDFVLVARAKGLPEGHVMRKHILRAAAPPILTSLILGLAGSMGGAILTETVFNWPGMGRLYYDAIMTLDEGLIIALTYLFTLIYVAARFLLEVLYVIVDPRVSY
jgi:peptide/nickel transport system permease protein